MVDYVFFEKDMVDYVYLFLLLLCPEWIYYIQVSVSHSSNEELKVNANQSPAHSAPWGDHGWFYISVRIGLFLWV